MARPGLVPVRMASPVTGMDAFTAGAWRDPDSKRSGRRPRSRAWMPSPRAHGETRTRSGPDGVPGHGHGCLHRGRMARPGLEAVRTASPVTGMDAFTAGAWRDPDSKRSGRRPRSRAWMPSPRAPGETRTRSGPDGVPGHGHGCLHRGRMARPGLEPGTPRFQRVAVRPARSRNTCKSSCLRSQDSVAMPSVSLGSGRVWDFAGALKSQSTTPPTIAFVRRHDAVAQLLGRRGDSLPWGPCATLGSQTEPALHAGERQPLLALHWRRERGADRSRGARTPASVPDASPGQTVRMPHR